MGTPVLSDDLSVYERISDAFLSRAVCAELGGCAKIRDDAVERRDTDRAAEFLNRVRRDDIPDFRTFKRGITVRPSA